MLQPWIRTQFGSLKWSAVGIFLLLSLPRKRLHFVLMFTIDVCVVLWYWWMSHLTCWTSVREGLPLFKMIGWSINCLISERYGFICGCLFVTFISSILIYSWPSCTFFQCVFFLFHGYLPLDISFFFIFLDTFAFMFHLQSCCYCLLLQSGTRVFFQYWWSCVLCYFRPVESCRSTVNSLYVSVAWKSIKFWNFFFFFFLKGKIHCRASATEANVYAGK